ncbi:vegetative cell wall protein gp1-like [Ischnura elegans]|uniref:vegetative cell wall protein gp1-like n=1 Tax=Ischnura elegans TaxID=197161 RepID=UPI001ED86E22|nr:vegetative cell wall protein gp1-like [Ischnura elegans]
MSSSSPPPPLLPSTSPPTSIPSSSSSSSSPPFAPAAPLQPSREAVDGAQPPVASEAADSPTDAASSSALWPSTPCWAISRSSAHFPAPGPPPSAAPSAATMTAAVAPALASQSCSHCGTVEK